MKQYLFFSLILYHPSGDYRLLQNFRRRKRKRQSFTPRRVLKKYHFESGLFLKWDKMPKIHAILLVSSQNIALFRAKVGRWSKSIFRDWGFQQPPRFSSPNRVFVSPSVTGSQVNPPSIGIGPAVLNPNFRAGSYYVTS